MTNGLDILNDAMDYGYAIPQFNINNLEWTKYILEECEANKSPVILGVSEGAIKYMGGYNVVSSLVKSLIKDLDIKIPVTLHLDHGQSYESCKKAIDAGFTSVMIDASKLDINENIKTTSKVKKYALKKSVNVEAEVGSIGGEEDGVANESLFATVDGCRKLVSSTKIDTLAPALGSVHGLYKGEPDLKFDTMLEISAALKMPLVLHGGTGIPDEDIKKAIECGTCKINFNTELQIAWSKAVRKFIAEDKDEYDPRKIISSGKEAIKESVRTKIILLGSNDRG